MKALVVLFTFLSCAFAQDIVAMYAGTNDDISWVPPVLDPNANPPSCSAGSVTTKGAYFDYNVTSAGVFHVVVMTEIDFQSYVRVFVYSDPFNPLYPCTNVIIKEWGKELGYNDDGGPIIADFIYLSVGNYWFVVTSSAADSVGLLAIHVDPAHINGVTDALSPVWHPAYYTGGSPCESSGTTPFGTYTWTQNGTGEYDLVAGWYNNTLADFSYTYLALYSGSQSAAAISANPCSAIIGDYNEGNGVTLWKQTLTNSQQYTVALSAHDPDEIGYWGLWIRPTIVVSLSNTSTWNQPERSVPCSASSTYTAASWFAKDVTAIGQVTIADTQILPFSQGFSYVDTYSWLFEGNQTTVPPPTCGGSIVTHGDTGGVTPICGLTTPDEEYTVIVSTYSGAAIIRDFALFVMSGAPIGNIPTSETTGGDGGSGCDTNELFGCMDTYTECASTTNTASELCLCFISFGACASCAGDCYTQGDMEAYVSACGSLGCEGCADFWNCPEEYVDGGGNGDGDGNGEGSGAVSIAVSIVSIALLAILVA